MDIYVGNIPYSATDGDLQQLFEAYGSVTSARIIIDKMSGRSKGFGFVEMPDNDEAQKAIDATNGSDLQGRPIRVNESQPRPQMNDRRGGGGGGGGDRW